MFLTIFHKFNFHLYLLRLKVLFGEKEKMKEKKKKGEGGRVNNFSLQIYIFQMKLFTIDVVDNVDNF
jgi:hypothetical protein